MLKFACPTVLSTSLVRVAVQQAGGHVLESLPGDLEAIALEFLVMLFLILYSHAGLKDFNGQMDCLIIFFKAETWWVLGFKICFKSLWLTLP